MKTRLTQMTFAGAVISIFVLLLSVAQAQQTTPYFAAEEEKAFTWEQFKEMAEANGYDLSLHDYAPGSGASVVLKKEQESTDKPGGFFGVWKWQNRNTLMMQYSYQDGVWTFMNGEAIYEEKAPLGPWQNDAAWVKGTLKKEDLDVFGKSFNWGPTLSSYYRVSG